MFRVSASDVSVSSRDDTKLKTRRNEDEILMRTYTKGAAEEKQVKCKVISLEARLTFD